MATSANRESHLSQDEEATEQRAIFVDPSGRRGRVVRRTSWLFGCLASAYVVLVLASLIVPAGLGRLTVPGLGPLLPGPAAPLLRDAGGAAQPPAQLLGGSASSKVAVATGSPTPTASTGQAATAPGQAATAPGQAATAPGQAATPPGQSGVNPTPRSTHAAAPTPHPSAN
jgi:hypothetical protein